MFSGFRAMPDPRSNKSPAAPIEVSPNNPLPVPARAGRGRFCRRPHGSAFDAFEEDRGGERREGLNKIKARVAAYGIALFANGNPLRSWWSGARLDALRDGPLDKHGAGSRILDASAHVHEGRIGAPGDLRQRADCPGRQSRDRTDQGRGHELHESESCPRQGPLALVLLVVHAG